MAINDPLAASSQRGGQGFESPQLHQVRATSDVETIFESDGARRVASPAGAARVDRDGQTFRSTLARIASRGERLLGLGERPLSVASGPPSTGVLQCRGGKARGHWGVRPQWAALGGLEGVGAATRRHGGTASGQSRRLLPARPGSRPRPLRNPDAPLTPFAMPEYKLASAADADRLDNQAEVLAATVVAFPVSLAV